MNNTETGRSLKEQTISGMLWSSVHRFGTMGISFIANLILARLLSPDDFGIIGMLLFFIDVANTIIDGGFGAALIQKKNPVDKDYSTIFYFNLILSALLFVILFISAPTIAKFYNQVILIKILRVLGLTLLFNAFTIIQTSQLIKQLNFKKLANINLISMSISSIIAIFSAFYGFGVWSLVIKYILLSCLQSISLWLWCNWRPIMVFNWSTFKELFGFGSYMLLTSFIDTIHQNIQLLIIGKFFTIRDVGFYTQAKKMVDFPRFALTQVVNQVTFPVFSQLQDDLVKIKTGVKKSLKSITYINFPLMILLIIIAKPIFTLLFTEKWDESVPYFQILCFGSMIGTINTTNTNIFKSLGKSNIYFYVQTTKSFVGLFNIFIGLQFGIFGIMYAITFNSYLFLVINAFFTGRLINYRLLEQVKDIYPNYILAIVAGVITYFLCNCFQLSNLNLLLLQCFMFTLIFIGVSGILKFEAYLIYLDVIKELFTSFKRRKI